MRSPEEACLEVAALVAYLGVAFTGVAACPVVDPMVASSFVEAVASQAVRTIAAALAAPLVVVTLAWAVPSVTVA